ncbi:Oidioi.mRNA.OKI2018_I69.XSR.g14795.t1.cds [Oikopleura dioica]|uniref:Oidioi.mRNA.OKI2018_I69.XSR.g14795.t1.cds n=1 Tax=Oikopleura dioica TaxID=34765 RepID=A0ABN7SJV4_OIKDI|nr:Oidioi.mRNA.OKI2018_I69.XSR.g14795.t1.cds [Oikopleura dioica]
MDADQAFEIVTNGKSLGWYSYYTFGLQLTTQVLVAFQMCLMVILTPILKNEEWPWHLSELQVSLASSIYMLGVMGGNFVMGIVADTYGRKRPYFAVLPLLIILQVFGTLCWSVNSFLAFRLVSGFLTGGLGLVGFVYQQELLPSNVWAISGNISPGVFAIGIAFLALIGQLFDSYSTILLISSLPFIFSLLPLFIGIPESPRWLLSQNRIDESAAAFVLLANKNGIKMDPPELKSPPAGEAAGCMMIFNKAVISRVTIMGILWFSASLCYYGLTLNLSGLHPNPNVSLCLSGLVEIPSYIIAFYLMESEFFGRRRSTSLSFFGVFLGCFSTIFALIHHAGQEGSSSAVLGSAMFGKLCVAAAFS